MTEKRFTVKHNPFTQPNIVYDGHRFASVHFDDIYKVCDKLNELSEENEQLKQTLQEVYDDDYYLKQFIIAIINSYGKNRGVSPIRLEMIWDSSDMDKTSLKHLKSSFYE